MATGNLLEALRARQQEEGLSLRQLATELGVTQPLLTMLYSGKRQLTRDTAKRIERFIRPEGSAILKGALTSFIQSGAHRSPKTIETLKVRLEPFIEHLSASNVDDVLDIRFEHVREHLFKIGQGRRGKPLSPASVFDYTKDVQAFLNYIAKTLAPEDWRNPARYIVCRHPQVSIHPLPQAQVDAVLSVAESLAPTVFLKARNMALLYMLLDGALRISELLAATKYQLVED